MELQFFGPPLRLGVSERCVRLLAISVAGAQFGSLGPPTLNTPKLILEAQKKGIEYFMSDDCEWKLDVTGQNKYVEETVGHHVLTFADNGYGDYLFLKVGDDAVYEFCHEGPEVVVLNEPLSTLLGLEERLPSKGPMPRYVDGQEVQLGDLVQIRRWWKKHDGEIVYVPGISRRQPELEHGGIGMIRVRCTDFELIMTVDPSTNVICGKIALVRRV